MPTDPLAVWWASPFSRLPGLSRADISPGGPPVPGFSSPDAPRPQSLPWARARGCFQRILDTMSVYCTFGVFDADGEDHPPPLIYQRSHVIPSATDPRGGYLDLASIPAFLTRNGDGYDDSKEDGIGCWPYLRVSLKGPVDAGAYDDTVVLDADQVRALRDELNDWLERVDPDLE